MSQALAEEVSKRSICEGKYPPLCKFNVGKFQYEEVESEGRKESVPQGKAGES